jgi:hypothetical protein
MTYRDLLKKLALMDSEQLDSDLTIFVQDEFYPAELLVTDEATEDRLDHNHPYLKIKDSE